MPSAAPSRATSSPSRRATSARRSPAATTTACPQAPGASDNATGTATILEIAGILADRGEMGSNCFVLFGAEELGLLGSQALRLHAGPGVASTGSRRCSTSTWWASATRLVADRHRRRCRNAERRWLPDIGHRYREQQPYRHQQRPRQLPGTRASRRSCSIAGRTPAAHASGRVRPSQAGVPGAGRAHGCRIAGGAGRRRLDLAAQPPVGLPS